MPATIFQGAKVKHLKDEAQLLNGASRISRAIDPTVSAVDAVRGSLLRDHTSGKWYEKLDDGLTTNWRLQKNGLHHNELLKNPDFAFGLTTNWTTFRSQKSFLPGDVNTGTEVITVTGHGYVHGQKVRVRTTTSLPAGLFSTNLYYVIYVDANNIQLTTSIGGSAVNITSQGSGTHYVHPVDLSDLQGAGEATVLDLSATNTASEVGKGLYAGQANYDGTATVDLDTDSRGDGFVADPIAVPEYIKGRNVVLSIWLHEQYLPSEPAALSDGILHFNAYDNTNNEYISVAGNAVYPRSGGRVLQYNFQVPSNCDELLIGYLINGSYNGVNSADFSFQVIEMIPESTVPGYKSSTWERFDLEITATGSNPTKGATAYNTAWARRDGPDMLIRVSYGQNAVGTAGSGTYLFGIPFGKSAHPDVTPGDTGRIRNISGTCTAIDSSDPKIGYPKVYDANNLCLVVKNGSGGALTAVSNTFMPLSGANQTYDFFARVPIEGWDDSDNISTTENLFRNVDIRGEGNAGEVITASTTDIPFAEVTDNVNLWTGSSYTSKKKERLLVKGSLQLAAGAMATLYAYINGSIDTVAATFPASTGIMPFGFIVDLDANQTLSLRSDTGFTLANNISTHYISISSISDTTKFNEHIAREVYNETAALATTTINQWVDKTSIVLQPGEHELSVDLTCFAAAAAATFNVGFSTTPGNVSPGTQGIDYASSTYTAGFGGTQSWTKKKIVVSVPTTYYLKVFCSTASGTSGYNLSAEKVV